MQTIYFKGEPCHTYGLPPMVGQPAPAFHLAAADLSDCSLDSFTGKRIVLNIFPSLDTEVCARSVRRFNEEAARLKDTAVVCVSMDPSFCAGFCSITAAFTTIRSTLSLSPPCSTA